MSVADLDREGVAQEVVGSAVLVQAADQVGDRARKSSPRDDRRVQQQPADIGHARPGPGQGPCPPASRSRSGRGPRGASAELDRPRHVEEVVAGDADAHAAVAAGGRARPRPSACSWRRPRPWSRTAPAGQPCSSASTRSIARFAPLTMRTLIGAPPDRRRSAGPVAQVLAARRRSRAGRPGARCRRGASWNAGSSSTRRNAAIVSSRSRYSSMSRFTNFGGRCVIAAREQLAQADGDPLDGVVEGEQVELGADRRDLDRHVVDVGAPQSGRSPPRSAPKPRRRRAPARRAR